MKAIEWNLNAHPTYYSTYFTAIKVYALLGRKNDTKLAFDNLERFIIDTKNTGLARKAINELPPFLGTTGNLDRLAKLVASHKTG